MTEIALLLGPTPNESVVLSRSAKKTGFYGTDKAMLLVAALPLIATARFFVVQDRSEITEIGGVILFLRKGPKTEPKRSNN
jgi:hypothetical protein